MTPELIGIITVGVALAALTLAPIARIEKRLERIEATQVEQGERLRQS